MKRQDHISWHDYFMGVAILSSHRSKDPSTQVGACIVSPQKKIVGVGYNGFPTCKNKDADKELPWTKESSNDLENKYCYVVHAEQNAIINSTEKLNDCSMYVTWYPCSECAKFIIKSGITEVIYLHKHITDRYRVSMEAATRMFTLAGVNTKQFTIQNKKIVLSYEGE